MTYRPDKNTPILKLSNLATYSFVACDDKAGNFTDALARIMKLKKGRSEGRKLLVYVSEKKGNSPYTILPENKDDPIICSLVPASNPDLFNIQVQRLAQVVVADITGLGGALIHGGLCSFRGIGAVMAGTGGIGKTTASNRLPIPWVSYSDDATLVVPDGDGNYNAHPWPTWSRFYSGGFGGAWEVEKSFPLAAIFFLGQAKTDCLESLEKYLAKAMLIETIEHVSRLIRREDKDKQSYIKKCICSADNIVSSVPVYRLTVSLEGEFWKEMEKVMPKVERFEKPDCTEKHLPLDYSYKKMHYIYRGLSMNPTFYEPEMLTIKPYSGKEPKKGDVICYKVDQKGESIVHRVISVRGSEIKTRGDNNAIADSYKVEKSAIIGRVIASRRGKEKRTIYGGFIGVLDMYWSRGYRKANLFISKLLYKSYHYLACSGVFRKLKPKNMIFKVVVFDRYSQKYPKLILNGRTVGTFDFIDLKWKINRPYRLFVNEQKLPVFDSLNPNMPTE